MPAEDWRRQPDPDGLVTSTIAIFQTGKGNAARGLRVEGARVGQTGFFHKRIDDAAWQFEATGLPPSGPFLNQDPAPVREPRRLLDHRLRGTLRREGLERGLDIEVLDFNLQCSPAQVRLFHDGAAVTAGGQPLELTLHHVHAMHTGVRPRRYWEQSRDAHIRGAILLPDDLDAIDDDEARAIARELLGDRRAINLHGTARPDRMALTEIAVGTPFLVPLHEKGLPFALYTLEARE